MDFQSLNKELFSFIQSSPTTYHAVSSASRILMDHGFINLSERFSWNLVPGGKYFVTRNQSSLFAFRMPKQDASRFSKEPITFQIVATHSDSPCFKLKENAEIQVENHYIKLNVEKYGGALLAPWFDRPLSIGGRIILQTEDGIESRLVNFDQDLAMIVNLAIHMNRTANDGTKYHIQTDLLPIIGSTQNDFSIKMLVAKQLQVPAEQILSMDLSLYNRMSGNSWGVDHEFISCPRLDDLQCAFTSIKALCDSSHPNIITAAVIFDSEEVGSQSRQGACSTFLKDCLERIYISLGFSREEFICALAGSFLLSADNGHALHPNYTGKSDPTHHPHLNGGVLIKYAANQKYTSDGLTGGIFRLLCEQYKIPYQIFYNHSDEAGGSTLGNLSMSQVSIPTVDIGVPLLAMHSPYETGGAHDTHSLYQALHAFYLTHIHCVSDGVYRLEQP